MRSLAILILITSTTLFACAQAEKNTDHPEADVWDSFGGEISSENAIAYSDLLAELEASDSVATKVNGTINSVCKMKGCWMQVSAADQTSPAFVKFKDYAFFVPKDAEGREVIMEGIAYKEITPVEELKHYAEDEGKSADEIAKITEPVEELKFMATGVLLKK